MDHKPYCNLLEPLYALSGGPGGWTREVDELVIRRVDRRRGRPGSVGVLPRPRLLLRPLRALHPRVFGQAWEGATRTQEQESTDPPEKQRITIATTP